MSIGKIVAIVGAVAILLVVIICAGSIFETNNAGYLQVKQAAVSGELSCKLDAGMYFQNFGSIHTYKEASTYHFTYDQETGDARDQSLPTQFNDGAKSKVSGSVRVLLPNGDCDTMTLIHRKFKSMEGVMTRLVLPALRKSLFASGPHMTAAESYAERRNEFASLVEDQLINGVIQVTKEPVETTDLVTGEKTVVYKIKKITCDTENGSTCVNGYERDKGVFREFSISLTNFVIDDIRYPKPVLKQIETQRAARMNIITKQAEAQEAEARAKKAASEAEAAIAETRAKEEVAKTERIVRAEADKAEAVLQAQKLKEVAKLDKEAAEFTKKQQILLGEGEATRKKLVMQADGALEKKLNALVQINMHYADALSKAQPGALVPNLQMGGQAGGTGAMDLVNLLTASAAKQLSLDLKVRGTKIK